MTVIKEGEVVYTDSLLWHGERLCSVVSSGTKGDVMVGYFDSPPIFHIEKGYAEGVHSIKRNELTRATPQDWVDFMNGVKK